MVARKYCPNKQNKRAVILSYFVYLSRDEYELADDLGHLTRFGYTCRLAPPITRRAATMLSKTPRSRAPQACWVASVHIYSGYSGVLNGTVHWCMRGVVGGSSCGTRRS